MDTEMRGVVDFILYLFNVILFVLYICFILLATLTSQTLSPISGRSLDDTQGEKTLQSARAERSAELRRPFCQSEQEKEMRH